MKDENANEENPLEMLTLSWDELSAGSEGGEQK